MWQTVRRIANEILGVKGLIFKTGILQNNHLNKFNMNKSCYER